MKLIFKAISMVIVTVGVMSYGTYLMTGRVPWSGLSFSKKPDLKLPAELSLPVPKAARQTIYKWKDSDGVWQFSSDPPQDNTAYQRLEVDPNANIIASVPVETPEEQEPEKPEQKNEKEASTDEDENPIGFPYSPERVKKLMDDAKNVQKTLDERAERQREMLNNL